MQPPSTLRNEPRWLSLSLLIHGLVLLALWFTPVRQLVLGGAAEKPKPKSRLTERQIEQIVEQVRVSAEDEAKDTIEQLRRTEEMVRENLQQSVDQYQQQAEQLASEAPDKAMDQLESVRDAQQQALNDAQEALDQLTSAANATTEEEARKDRTEARVLQQKVNESQAAALDAQKEMDRMLEFMDESFQEVKAATQEARDAQQAAAEAQDEARAMTKEVRDLEASIPRNEDRLQRQQDAADSYQKRADSAAADLENRTEAVQKAQEQVKQAEKDGSAADVAKSKANLEKSEKKAEDAAKRKESYTQRAENAQQSVEETKARLDQDRQTLEEVKSQLVGAQEKVVDSQKKAVEHQQQAEQKLSQAVQNKLAASSAPVPEQTAAVLDTPPPSSLDQKNLAELYAEAVATEQRVAELYRQQKATDAATMSQTPLTEALANTQSVVSDRPEMNSELLTKSVGTLEEGQAHREELDRMETEMSDIKATVQRLGAMSSQGASSGTGFSVSTMMTTTSTGEAGEGVGASASTLASQLQQLAAENSSTQFQDMSQLMRAAMGMGQGQMKSGAPSGSGTSAPEPRGVPPAMRIGATPTGRGNPGWVYLNNWYMLGPFENPNRRHLDTHFPPESVIDLDAVYRDENGRELNWYYQNNPKVRLVPRTDQPYSIFYGYTEVWCETDMDRVIAIGSDDYSQVWVNGIQVWASGKQQKAWKPDEGLRKVYFQKGINRILMRLENGQYGSSMSVMINLEP